MITVAGSIIADIFARTVHQLPEPGTVGIVDEIGFHLGGSVSNTGAVLARLDVPVSVVGRVGNDALGRLVRKEVSRWAAKTTLEADLELPTSSVVAHILPGGERSFLYALGACKAFTAAEIDLDLEVRDGSRLLHVGYALLLPALDGSPMAKLFSNAHERGLLVSLDVAYHPEARWDDLRELLPLVDIFCPNIQEASAMTGQSEPRRAAEALAALGVRKFVAVKSGDLGAYALPIGEQGQQLFPFAVKVVDSTGAGDAFIAGLLAAWYRGFDWHRSAVIANAVGALAVTRSGASEGIDTWEQATDLVRTAAVHTFL